MHYDRTVIGYHGCSAETAERVLAGEQFTPSKKAYDWLGTGVYFWEFGLGRAWQWANDRRSVPKPPEGDLSWLSTDDSRVGKGAPPNPPAVVGAIIQLGSCFDLLDTRFTETLAQMASLYVDQLRKAGKPVPMNSGADHDLKKRFFDCAFINWSLDYLENQPEGERAIYQCVRGCFPEGTPIYCDPDPKGARSAILRESHIQIAVRDLRCIIGTFRPQS